ncbi:MAG: 50S ribosomal protein L23 [Patescibacteria group bacterium]|nr:50S ribosomal protein L23 [Patescibacteria group bacterium]MDE1944405.1 50S ribosomal protein L23 [Patescibacteria group bacterium]MDE1945396.1 50S ribosomal protein L23 [Patescibacteria group bacterium]MDE2057464.1 50S ribosomal protein L23 [Patescibacteria group bacterium]
MALFTKDKKKREEKAAAPRHAHATGLAGGEAHDVIRAPWFSEKALIGTEKGVYVFAVTREATSAEIAGAIKEIYGVAPKAVRIVNTPGKKKALRTRRGFGTRAARRKAYVALNAGDTIALA